MHTEINTPKWNDRILVCLRSLMNPRTIILGVTIVYFIVMAVRLVRWHQEHGQARVAAYPDWLDIPILLIVAAMLLWSRRWWTELLALLPSARVLYISYVGIRGSPFVSDLDPSVILPLRIWLFQTYTFRPQEFLEIALALMITCYVLVSLSRRWLRRRVDVKPVKTG